MTTFPAFFEQVPGITVHDPLADLLGAAQGGLVHYGYADAVRLAGHSCPTVASAYWLGVRALRALYGEAVPQRGMVAVELREAQDAGTTGVVASVLGLLTGAAGDGGFAGLGGQFVRRGLLRFNAPIDTETALYPHRHRAVRAGASPCARSCRRPADTASDAVVPGGAGQRRRTCRVWPPLAGPGAPHLAGACP
jgi:hypothetical protein